MSKTLEPNCIKIISHTSNRYESLWGKELGKYNRIYEIGKPTIPERGTLLFCYAIDEEVLSYIIENCYDTSFYAYADVLIQAKLNSKFSFCPIEENIPLFWNNERSVNIPEIAILKTHWRFASSITLLSKVINN